MSAVPSLGIGLMDTPPDERKQEPCNCAYCGADRCCECMTSKHYRFWTPGLHETQQKACKRRMPGEMGAANVYVTAQVSG